MENANELPKAGISSATCLRDKGMYSIMTQVDDYSLTSFANILFSFLMAMTQFLKLIQRQAAGLWFILNTSNDKLY